MDMPKYVLPCHATFETRKLIGPGCNHLNPPPISKVPSAAQAAQATPSQQPSPSPSTPSHKPLHPAPRPRRNLSDRGTPRSSKLQEVFSAGDQGDEDEDDGGKHDNDRMDVDEQK